MVMMGLALLVILGIFLWMISRPRPLRTAPTNAGDAAAQQDRLVSDASERRGGAAGKSQADPTRNRAGGSDQDEASSPILLFCAAGIRRPVEKIVAAYEDEYGVNVQIQYGGSNTLLSQLGVSRSGDLFLAADASYTQLARDRGLVRETLPLATQCPVVAVAKGNPKNITRIDDLLREDVTVALGNPDQAAIGRSTRRLLRNSNHWARLEAHITRTGVFKPTVPEVANDIKLGSIDAGVVWDTTIPLYPELTAIRTPELDQGLAFVTLGVLSASQQPSAALHLARYMAARDRGLPFFTRDGFEVVEGDVWSDVPEITFFCGAVNRRAVEDVVREFEQRERVRVTTVYNGCGILTAQMRTLHGQHQSSGFPDTYMACDRYYLETVGEWFQEDVDVSDTEVVIAVPKGNPADSRSLRDLTKPGVRVALGQPEQCTIGVLSRRLLESEGLYEAVLENVVTQTASSAMLLPTVITGSVDATLAYATDTLAESDKVETIRVTSDAATAIQPFAISKESQHKYLSRRFYEAITLAKDQFEAAGFRFRLPTDPPRNSVDDITD